VAARGSQVRTAREPETSSTGPGRRLVCYSLTLPRGRSTLGLLWQLEASVRSLRAHNTTVSVVVFLHGEGPSDLTRRLAALNVHVWPLEPYEVRLQRLLPRGWQPLAHYPVLHKFLNFTEIASLDPSQVLFLDCDTIFAGDVAALFAGYAGADCYAREEPTCRRSHYGYDPGYVDETALAQLAAAEGIMVPPPFNLGVVLWNRALWRRVPRLDALVAWYAWRFLVWLAMHPVQDRAVAYGESEAAAVLAQHFRELVGPEDVRAALPYPSANRWILDQMALWFALGHAPGLSYADFSRADVLQNGEFLALPPGYHGWIVCHYFSQNTERIDRWIRRGSRDGSSAVSTPALTGAQ
jgi:hypothetical protein